MPQDGAGDFLCRLFGLGGRVAIVTGASRGIGAAIAQGLSAAGAQVFGVARSPRPEWHESAGLAYQASDVGDAAAFAAFCRTVAARTGRIDVLVNAAGISLAAGDADPLTLFDRTLAVNLRGAYACCLAVIDSMTAAGGGSIINVTSIGSVLGFPGNPGYVAAKGGLRQMTRALAVDLGPAGIRVNNLAPGYIHTRMTEASHADAERHRQRLQHMALPRWGTPQDLVGAAVFLASDASTYVTGQDIFVDGGWTAKGLASLPQEPER